MSSRPILLILVLALCVTLGIAAERNGKTSKHTSGLGAAPATAHARSNPYEGNPEAFRAGRKLFERYCADCHGADSRGKRRAPGLESDRIGQAPPGDLFWFLTNGDLRAGMPSWSRLPEAQRWQIVTYLKSLRETQAH